MSAAILFEDVFGPAVLHGGPYGAADALPAAATRFREWTPFSRPVGPVSVALGTGARTVFEFRRDHGARFVVEEIEVPALAVADRLLVHLLAGGTVTVRTGDALGAVYPSCVLAPESEPELGFADPSGPTFRLTLSLVNLDAAPMTALYLDAVEEGALSVLFTPDVIPAGISVTRADAALYFAP